MFGAFQKRGWRGAIGLIAIYALLLQAFLAYGMAAQAAAQGDSTNAFFVICTSHDGAVALDGADAPARPAAHCPICTLSASTTATLPTPISLPLRHDIGPERTPAVSDVARGSPHEARAGLSRAPPHQT